jgi:hypothetical protein
MLIQSFAAAAASWQSFYILTGTAAATLMGLMFVAVTFGAGLATPETAPAARAFLDPPFYHFAQVLLAACLMIVPTVTTTFAGVALIVLSLYRLAILVRVHRYMREASAKYNDLEISDWLSGIVVPLLCHVVLGASGGAFLARAPIAFDGVALATVAILALGLYGAWELILWLALTRAKHSS